MRVLLIGTVEFSLRTLEKLIGLNVDVVGVCTKETSSFNSDFSDLKPICTSNSIPCLYVNDINSKDSVKWIKELKPDIIFCFGWSSLIKKDILNIPPMGVVGYHPAKLPENRGRHPLIWALVLGLEESASTFFFMNDGADDGDILSQVDFSILYSDNARSIYNKVISIASEQIEEFMPKLQSKNYLRIKQDHKSSNVWRKRHKSDGLIDFRMSSRAIYNLVRALTKPYVGAHVEYRGHSICIWKIREIENSLENLEPGRVLEVGNTSFIVKSFDNAVEIVDHDFKILPTVGECL
jgi:methionyl-tRNA formyltransferase